MYLSFLKKFTLTKWRWPLLPFALVAAFFVFVLVGLWDAAFGIVSGLLLIGGSIVIALAGLFAPEAHAKIRAKVAEFVASVIGKLARHPRVVATLRNPRWYVYAPAWCVVFPLVLLWAVVRFLCGGFSEAAQWVDDKLHMIADYALFQHMRAIYAWMQAKL